MRIFRMIFECATPLHCGSGADDILQDQPVVRDAFGLWRIPGSSLAGAIRSLATAIDEKMAAKMFGYAEKDKGAPSLVWCEDAILLDFDGAAAVDKKLAGNDVQIPLGPFTRDHVNLDLEKDSAVAGGKFDAEIVPAGTRFFLEIRCDGWNRNLDSAECEFFDRLCALVLAGKLALGGKNSNGYGQYRALTSGYREVDLTSAEGMLVWLNLSRRVMFAASEGRQLPLPAADQVIATTGLNGSLQMRLACNGPVLIGGGQPERADGSISEADMVFVLTPMLDYERKRLRYCPVVPGSSLKGMLRHAVYRILRDRYLDQDKAEAVLNGLFGHIKGDKGQCGKLLVEDCELKPAVKYVLAQHVAIDSFTGGAYEGALFSEEPVWTPGRELPFRLHVREASASEAALIFHALLDMAEGMLAIGGGCNRGNGRLQAADNGKAENFLAGLAGDIAWQGTRLLAGDGAERLRLMQNLAMDWDKAANTEAYT